MTTLISQSKFQPVPLMQNNKHMNTTDFATYKGCIIIPASFFSVTRTTEMFKRNEDFCHSYSSIQLGNRTSLFSFFMERRGVARGGKDCCIGDIKRNTVSDVRNFQGQLLDS
jgi:hypothetical protein